tara:strand:+ start:693 stop:908 length:216 start_codon:yes stop_codon:yes gene_type:complete
MIVPRIKSTSYKKIELILREDSGEIKVSHENSDMLISGNFMVITTSDDTHQKGEIYKLDKIKSYRTNLEKI